MHQPHLWTTPTTNNAPTTAPSTDTQTSNHNTSSTSSSIHAPNMEIRQIQRASQISDEEEHVQINNESQRELLQDKLQKLRQRIHDIEQDNWKYDIVR